MILFYTPVTVSEGSLQLIRQFAAKSWRAPIFARENLYYKMVSEKESEWF